ncbi:MAG: MerR family transcriptional regulator [Candidatus Accumulibacter meliphilus]|uniref:MerR family transcriptional regulator n=1 Tax=Candidatus Accumulibacter meliphilus TaxID=2211374 RepID=A0A369XIX1_9PROT|nr:MAG: MerR family transcriptional regulator [Candidatus Accumulibacter meliphilus]
MTTLPSMNISAVERDTGLGKDTLRVWERRYGFPQPARNDNGERVYPAEQVDRLRQMKRLIDQGHRPGRLVAASDEEFAQLCSAATSGGRNETAAGEASLIARMIALVKANDVPALRQALNQAMMRMGLQRFVIDVVAPLNDAVGEAWMTGEFQVFEEHLYTEQIKSLLRQAIGNLPTGGGPRVLLTTPPDEQHVLGLLMVEALLGLDGATCISLGTQTPLVDIQRATAAHAADIVAVSLSAAFSGRQVRPLLSQLRAMLPATVELWVGGAGAQPMPAQSGIVSLPTLQAALDALESWRKSRANGD